ncbi:MAG: hypothetical protein IJ039_09020 [Clostridia bacterium]|nr:hypothetical protein [Clostridia bacterium]
MPWWSYILIALAVILMVPYIRLLFKRISLYFMLKSFCKQEKLILHRSSMLWWLGIKKGGRCNFYIEAPDSIYSVKLFPVLKRKCCFHFLEERKYYIEKFLIFFGLYGSSARFSFKSRIHNLGELNFKYKFNEEWNTKEFIPILLFNPTCASVKLKTDNNEQVIGDGDAVYEFYIFGMKGLMKKISNGIN